MIPLVQVNSLVSCYCFASRLTLPLGIQSSGKVIVTLYHSLFIYSLSFFFSFKHVCCCIFYRMSASLLADIQLLDFSKYIKK